MLTDAEKKLINDIHKPFGMGGLYIQSCFGDQADMLVDNGNAPKHCRCLDSEYLHGILL